MKKILHPQKIPAVLTSISIVGLIFGFLFLKKAQYQLLALILVVITFFAAGLEGFLIIVYKRYTNLKGEVLTGRKIYLKAAFLLIVGWGTLLSAWFLLSK